MATADAPVTRAELREEFREFRSAVQKHIETLRNELRAYYVTKGDLNRAILELGLLLTGIMAAGVAILKFTT